MKPTKEQVEKLIDALADKKETLYRCNRVWEAWQVSTMTEDDFEAVESEILIGDVLEKFCNSKPLFDMCLAEEIIDLWRHLGFDKSVQQIIEASGWETNACFPGKHGVAGAVCGGLHPNCQAVEVLKSPEASRLFKFLADILNLN